MNKKFVAIFLIAMVLVAGVILIGIRVFSSDSFKNLFAKESEETTLISEITLEEMTTTSETIPEVLSFASEADAMNYVSSYASNNGIDFSYYPQRIFSLLYRNPDSLQFVLDYPIGMGLISEEDMSLDPSSVTTTETFLAPTVETSEESEAVNPSDPTSEITTAITSIVSLEGDISTARLVELYTWDSRWGYTTYGNGPFCFTGSAPTCVSIVAMYLLRNPALSPQWIAAYSMGNGYCDSTCDGSNEWSLVGDGGYGLGINVTQIPASDEDRIKRNLDVPNSIICDVGDHYIILLSYEDEEFTVFDPTSEYDTNRTWSWTELSQKLEALWVYRII